METPHPKPSAFKRFVRRTLFAVAALITLAALVLAEENWRGARAWQSYKRAMEAKGERFDAARLIPPNVPDDQNFAMTPLFAPIFTLPRGDPRQPIKSDTVSRGNDQYGSANGATNIDLERLLSRPYGRPPHPLGWDYGMAADLSVCAAAMQGTNGAALPDSAQAASIILDKMKSSEPTLTELQAAAARRYCRFNINYEVLNKPDDYAAIVEHFTLGKWLFRFLTLHAEAEMVVGRTDQALKDLNVMFRVDDGLKDEPLIISQLVRMADMALLLQPVGEGLAEHRWSEDQLRLLQERLQKTDLIASTVRAFYGERDICYNPAFDQGYMFPRGWNRLEQLDVDRAFQNSVLARIDLAAREVNPSVNHSIDLAFRKSHPATGFRTVLHHQFMAKAMLQVFSSVSQKAAFAQNHVDLAMLACALERYRLAQARYPDDLDALVPLFLPVLPHDIINGQPLKYRRTDDGRFILYSVGWNEKDDGGIVAASKDKPPRQDILQGDWVWQYPEKP
jgi:hypothetical protein